MLLAKELSDLATGKHGVLKFLDNCSTAMKVKNAKGVQDLTRDRTDETRDRIDKDLAVQIDRT